MIATVLLLFFLATCLTLVLNQSERFSNTRLPELDFDWDPLENFSYSIHLLFIAVVVFFFILRPETGADVPYYLSGKGLHSVHHTLTTAIVMAMHIVLPLGVIQMAFTFFTTVSIFYFSKKTFQNQTLAVLSGSAFLSLEQTFKMSRGAFAFLLGLGVGIIALTVYINQNKFHLATLLVILSIVLHIWVGLVFLTILFIERFIRGNLGIIELLHFALPFIGAFLIILSNLLGVGSFFGTIEVNMFRPNLMYIQGFDYNFLWSTTKISYLLGIFGVVTYMISRQRVRAFDIWCVMTSFFAISFFFSRISARFLRTLPLSILVAIGVYSLVYLLKSIKKFK